MGKQARKEGQAYRREARQFVQDRFREAGIEFLHKPKWMPKIVFKLLVNLIIKKPNVKEDVSKSGTPEKV